MSDEAILSLQSSYTHLHAQASANFKTAAKEVIFSELPENDRLQAYQNYINCIESPDFSDLTPENKTSRSVAK